MIYIVDLLTDHLFKVDPATLAVTDVGALGVAANYAQGMDFEEESGVLYWAAYTTAGELRVIDTATGASALVGGFPAGAETDCLAFRPADNPTCRGFLKTRSAERLLAAVLRISRSHSTRPALV
jgi:hypothetical protein